MRIRIFRAATAAEAMRQVRDELGLDALILATASQGGVVEVTAALELEDEPDPLPASFDALPPVAFPEASPRTLSPPSDPPSPPAPLHRHNLPPELLSALQDGPLEAACSRLFRFAALPLDAAGPPLLLAGPPGAGKTLTVAKLAARLVMDGHTPMVITADEQRAGAVEQLAAFTRLLGLTLIAAGRPETLARALARREPSSPVLIDAPGLDLSDPSQEDLLASLVAAARARICLVLPAGLDPAEAAEIAVAHAAQGTELLIATRLERRARLGGVLAAAHGADLALTEAGTGTDVADGLTRLTPTSLSARLAATPPSRSQAPAVAAPVLPGPSPAVTTANVPAAPGRNTLALHIAAQAGAHRPSSWKTNS